MLKLIAIALVGLIALILILAATRPSAFRYQRAVVIEASPETLYPFIANFHRWASWSPYEKMDPEMKRTYSGAEEGEGAVYGWDSQGKAGVGRMEIIETSFPDRIKIRLEFDKPFRARNTAEFTMKQTGGATTLTWMMYGSQPFMSKLIGLFLNLDKLVGNDFETGLDTLKNLAEAQPSANPA